MRFTQNPIWLKLKFTLCRRLPHYYVASLQIELEELSSGIVKPIIIRSKNRAYYINKFSCAEDARQS